MKARREERGRDLMLARKGVEQEGEKAQREEHGTEGLIIQASPRSERWHRGRRKRDPVAALRSRPDAPERVPGCCRNGCPGRAEYALWQGCVRRTPKPVGVNDDERYRPHPASPPRGSEHVASEPLALP